MLVLCLCQRVLKASLGWTVRRSVCVSMVEAVTTSLGFAPVPLDGLAPSATKVFSQMLVLYVCVDALKLLCFFVKPVVKKQKTLDLTGESDMRKGWPDVPHVSLTRQGSSGGNHIVCPSSGSLPYWFLWRRV